MQVVAPIAIITSQMLDITKYPRDKASLCVKEGLDLNIIFGENFSDTDISPSGRLKPGANSVFFPRQWTTFHDHSYFYKILEQPEDEGMYLSFQPLGWVHS